jgi:hypothetical protein
MSATNGSEEAMPVEAVAVVEPVPVPPPAPVPVKLRKLEEMEIVKLENAFLKIDSIKKNKTILERDMQLADAHLLVQQQQLSAFRDQLSQKYGVDLVKARIAPDGTIIPNAATIPTAAAQNPIAAALAAAGPRN